MFGAEGEKTRIPVNFRDMGIVRHLPPELLARWGASTSGRYRPELSGGPQRHKNGSNTLPAIDFELAGH